MCEITTGESTKNLDIYIAYTMDSLYYNRHRLGEIATKENSGNNFIVLLSHLQISYGRGETFSQSSPLVRRTISLLISLILKKQPQTSFYYPFSVLSLLSLIDKPYERC